MKTISEQLGTIIGLGIDLNHFFSVNVSSSTVTLIGNHSDEVQAYLITNGFKVYEYLYSDNPDWIELIKDGCRVALSK
jgi:hypothetical protein